ncbi:DUF3526 domain-containing protein [Sinomicrobium sp. M5D2P9]
MFTYNFKYELKMLFRSRWMQLLTILLLVLFVFAGYNGKQKTGKRMSDIAAAQATVKASDAETSETLHAIESGEELNLSPWVTPTSPMNVGNKNPRVAAMPANAMAFMAVGQSDVYTHYVMPTVSGDDFAINLTEMTSPIQLLFGSFDLAFVIVYLLPLIIIAFSYNILSEEKERGTLRLLTSQPISIRRWVLQKLGIRLFWLFVLVFVAATATFLINGVGSFEGYITLLGICLAYMLFWFSLTFAVSLGVGQSAKNAFVLLGLWIVFVLLIPSTINQMSDALYPVPSRNQLIGKVRELKAEATEKQDEILDNYLRDHPEYAVNDSTQSRSFWHSYMASRKLVEEQLYPLLADYDNSLENRQKWIDKLQWLSPAILVQQELIRRAGTSKTDYENYRQQVLRFSDDWRDFFMPLLYNNEFFTSGHLSQLPEFEYRPNADNSGLRIWGILGLTALVLGVTTMVYKVQVEKEKNIA